MKCYVDFVLMGNVYDDCIIEGCSYADNNMIMTTQTCPYWREATPEELRPEDFCECCGQKLREDLRP